MFSQNYLHKTSQKQTRGFVQNDEKIATLNANLGQNGVSLKRNEVNLMQNEVNFLGQNSTQTLANERERERERERE